jgi:hypothetical protein
VDSHTQKSLKRAFIFQVAMTALTVVSAVVTVMTSAYLWVALIVAAGMVVAQIYLYQRTTLNDYREFSSEDDAHFCEYFSSWYAQDGEHRIFCKDLDWLDNARVAAVLKALTDQGPRVKIFVSIDSANAVGKIRAAGGLVVKVPSELVHIQMKFSLHEVDTSKRMIVRRKKPNHPGVRFIETSDTISLGLAETVMVACEQLSFTNGQIGNPALPQFPENGNQVGKP